MLEREIVWIWESQAKHASPAAPDAGKRQREPGDLQDADAEKRQRLPGKGDRAGKGTRSGKGDRAGKGSASPKPVVSNKQHLVNDKSTDGCYRWRGCRYLPGMMRDNKCTVPFCISWAKNLCPHQSAASCEQGSHRCPIETKNQRACGFSNHTMAQCTNAKKVP